MTNFPLHFPAHPVTYLIKGFVGPDDHLGFIGSDPNILGVFRDTWMLHCPGGNKRREQHKMSSRHRLHPASATILEVSSERTRVSPQRRRLYFPDRTLKLGMV